MPRILTRAAFIMAALSIPVAHELLAQDAKPRVVRPSTVAVSPGFDLMFARSADRAVLGVTMATGSRADTAGVRVEEVDADGPAAKAGIKSGDVITEINGVSLRLSAADAEDFALAGIGQRRLQRALTKAKPGDEVDLRVRSGGAMKSVKVKTVSAADLDGSRQRIVARPRADDNNGAIGLSISTTGSVRDTLGLFISSVVGTGPAEKAGVIEGERIASVNGVDVRVPKEDLEDGASATARVNRFVREVRKVAPGSNVALRVYGNGRYRDVTVAAVKMSDLPSSGWQMSVGDGAFQILRGANPPGGVMTLRGMPSGTISIPRPSQGRVRMNGTINGEPFDFNSEPIEQAMQHLRERMQELGRDIRIELRDSIQGPVRDSVRNSIRLRTSRGMTRM